MYSTLAAFALAAAPLVSAAPQAPQQLGQSAGPKAGAPAPGCESDYPVGFQIKPVNITTSSGIGKRSALVERQTGPGSLVLSLAGGSLTANDPQGDAPNIGYVADNFQFQFDNPVQTGALSAGGFAVCNNQTEPQEFFTLALGDTSIFWSCPSGGFSNLYDRNWAPQCSPIKLQVINSTDTSGGPVGGSGSSGATTTADGQPTAQTSAAGVTQTSDSQPQAPTSASGVTQIGDSQPQAPTSASGVTQIGDSQPQAPTSAAGVTQIGDSQPQAPTSAAGVTQIGDSQPQAPTSAAGVTQIGDSQPQAPTSAAGVTQIADNQPQVPTSVSGAITQISDAQPQAPTAAGAVTQIGDNQPQVPTAASPYATPARYTGAAAANGLSHLALAGAAAVGIAML